MWIFVFISIEKITDITSRYAQLKFFDNNLIVPQNVYFEYFILLKKKTKCEILFKRTKKKRCSAIAHGDHTGWTHCICIRYADTCIIQFRITLNDLFDMTQQHAIFSDYILIAFHALGLRTALFRFCFCIGVHIRSGIQFGILFRDGRNLITVLNYVHTELLAIHQRWCATRAQQTCVWSWVRIFEFVRCVHPSDVLTHYHFLIEPRCAQWTFVRTFAGMDPEMFSQGASITKGLLAKSVWDKKVEDILKFFRIARKQILGIM